MNTLDKVTDQLHAVYRSLPCQKDIDLTLMEAINILNEKYPLTERPAFEPNDFVIVQGDDYFNSDSDQFGSYDSIE